MGVVVEQGGARGRRPLDASVNLVPYVDILMTLMVFLVMCAIFTQISSLTVHGKSAGDATAPTRPPEPSDPPLSLLVTARAVSVERDGKRIEVAREAAAIERAIRDVVPEPNADTLCTLRSDDGISYGDLVEIIDVTRRVGITNVSLEPAAS